MTPVKIRRWNPTPFVLFGLGAIVTAITLTRPFDENVMLLVGNYSYGLGALLALCFGIAATRHHSTRSPLGKLLFLLTITFGLDIIAGQIWGYYELTLGILAPFPSWADAVWSLAYIINVIALTYPLRILWNRIRPRTAAYVLLGGLAVVVLLYVTTLRVIIADPDYTLPMKLLSLYYPIASLMLLGLAALLFTTLRTGVFGKAWRIFLIGFMTFAIADLAYTYFEWNGTYASGTWPDALYFISQLLFAYGFYKHIIAVKD